MGEIYVIFIDFLLERNGTLLSNRNSLPSGGRRENFRGISCEKSLFYAKKSYFFTIAEGGSKIFGIFRVKNHDFTPKNYIFSNFRGRGARAGWAPPPGSAPVHVPLPLARFIIRCTLLTNGEVEVGF